ncbi:MAG TPA: hypothetical protein VH740_13135 [Vicinamibacterales bacterium]|jgi:hypothetical protein
MRDLALAALLCGVASLLMRARSSAKSVTLRSNGTVEVTTVPITLR